MLVREYQEKDLDTLLRIHAKQSFPYEFPDLSNPLFVTKIVLQEGSQRSADAANSPGKILGAVLLRLTAEAYLLLDPEAGTPRQRWQSLLTLHAAAEREAWHRGLEDVHAWLPPPIAKTFGKRIERLGWVRDNVWSPYCKRIQEF